MVKIAGAAQAIVPPVPTHEACPVQSIRRQQLGIAGPSPFTSTVPAVVVASRVKIRLVKGGGVRRGEEEAGVRGRRGNSIPRPRVLTEEAPPLAERLM